MTDNNSFSNLQPMIWEWLLFASSQFLKKEDTKMNRVGEKTILKV